MDREKNEREKKEKTEEEATTDRDGDADGNGSSIGSSERGPEDHRATVSPWSRSERSLRRCQERLENTPKSDGMQKEHRTVRSSVLIAENDSIYVFLFGPSFFCLTARC